MSFAIPVEVYIALPYVLAVLLGVGVPFAGWLQFRLAARVRPEIRTVIAMVLVAVGALLSVALTQRTLNEAAILLSPRATYDDYAEGFAASRWLTLLLLGMAAIEIVRGWMKARAASTDDPAKPILIVLLTFYLGTIGIEAFAAEVPGFTYKALYVPILLVAVYYQRVENTGIVIEAGKWLILLLNLASLGWALHAPDFVIHRPEHGMLPGIDWRLFGLTPHANTLGPIALLACLLELHSPSRWRSIRALHLASAFAVFVLAQSKTAWGAAAVIVALVYVPLAMARGTGDAAARAHFRRATLTLLGCIGVLIVVAIGLAAIDSSGAGAKIDVDVDTLTGRTQIWEITLNAWRENVLFGYGPEVWGFRRRLQFNMFHVGQAHNQAIQTLGEAGLFGLVLLTGYLGTLVLAALRVFTASRGLLLAMLLLVLARCVTEAPLSADGILSWTTFMLVLLVVLTCHHLREHASVTVPGRVPSSRHAGPSFMDTVPSVGIAHPARASRRGWA